MSPLIGKYARS